MQPMTQQRTKAPALETLGIPPADVRRIVDAALAEDLGWGDITTDNLVPEGAMARAAVAYRSGGIVCGSSILAVVFRSIDERVEVEVRIPDGERVEPGAVAAIVRGPARSILKGERVALNFVQRMAAIATAAARYVAEVGELPVHVIDTRKHLVALRNQGIGTIEALRLLRDRIPHTVRIQVEVDRLDQIPDMLEAGVDAILFDNMTPEQVREGVRMIAGRAVTAGFAWRPSAPTPRRASTSSRAGR
jgi:nicotinate-nucleotide pyrophosphorylase (carboxylating)